MNDTKIVEAVGLGKAPYAYNWRKQITRFFLRKFFAFTLNRRIPYSIREKALMFVCQYHKGFAFVRGGSIGDTFENDLMKLIFNATAIANVADNASSSPLTSIAVALHTADPGETGTQSTSETNYTSYARVSVTRTSSGWTITNNSVSPVANIDFPAGTGGSGTVTHFSVGPTGGGATKIFFSGTVSPNIVVGNGVTPRLTTASTITID